MDTGQTLKLALLDMLGALTQPLRERLTSTPNRSIAKAKAAASRPHSTTGHSFLTPRCA
jgi:hypothetical protein